MRTTGIPLIFLLSGWALVLAIWVVLDQGDTRSIRFETESTAEHIQLQLESCVQTRIALIDSLSDQDWRDQRDVIKNWPSATRPLLNIYSGVQAVNFVDDDGVIRVVAPVAGNESALGKNLKENPNPDVPEALNKARVSQQTARTNTITLLQSGRGFAAYKQLLDANGNPLGFINSVFRIDALMQYCLRAEVFEEKYRYQLLESDGSLIYGQGARPASGVWDYEVNQPVAVIDKPWRLLMAPKTSYLNSMNSYLDEALSLVGAVLTFLLAWAIRTLLTRQNSLQESEARYRFLIENQSDLVVHYSANMEIIYASPNYCQLHGKSSEEIVGTLFEPEIFETDQHIFSEIQDRLRTPPFVSHYDRMREKIEGDWRWFGWSSSGAVDDNGNLETVTAIGRDITELMRLEVQISQAQKMQAVGQMAGGISHDFNNLLQVMLANVEFVLEDLPEDSHVKADLSRVLQSIHRAMDLSQKLGSLNRQQPHVLNVFDLEPMLNQFVELLSRTIPSSIRISFEPSSVELKIRADASELEQVLLNLCFNARDSIEGNGRIWISLNRVVSDVLFRQRFPEFTESAYVCIRIKDDGCGMDAESLGRIFDPFYTTKAAGSGTGLGLTNCYSIIRQHDGLILADSKPGRGSTFRVYLPLTEEALTEDLTDAEPEEDVDAGLHKILVVDDDSDVLDLTCRTLETAGYETVRAIDGARALTLLRQGDSGVTLVVMDLVMPVMDGRTAGGIIADEFPNLKILYVSGYDPDSRAPDSAPLNGPLIRKPYRATELYEAISRLISQRVR